MDKEHIISLIIALILGTMGILWWEFIIPSKTDIEKYFKGCDVYSISISRSKKYMIHDKYDNVLIIDCGVFGSYTIDTVYQK